MPKVLIVDDEPDILELMQEDFECEGFNVNTARSGNEALQVLKEDSSYQIIISDYKMSDGSGAVILDFINRLDSKRPLFYFVSGQADMTTSEAQSYGANRFFYKPFDIDQLIKQVKDDLKKEGL